MKRSEVGVALMELLVSIAIIAIIVPAITFATAHCLRYNQQSDERHQVTDEINRFEDRMKTLVESAYLHGTASDTTTYFILSTSTNAVDSNPDTLTFTIYDYVPAGSYLRSQEDFEQRNRYFGPQGGMKEVSLSPEPKGDVDNPSGLFLREQRPADADTEQGGVESVMNEQIETIHYECWDGVEWLSSWDTSTMSPPRLPAAIKVTYKLKEEPLEHVFVVRLRNSDVTMDNPVTSTSGVSQ